MKSRIPLRHQAKYPEFYRQYRPRTEQSVVAPEHQQSQPLVVRYIEISTVPPVAFYRFRLEQSV